jgi:hypothetical protein
MGGRHGPGNLPTVRRGLEHERLGDTTEDAKLSATEAPGGDVSGAAGPESIDMKFEVVVIPVSDVDRAEF